MKQFTYIMTLAVLTSLMAGCGSEAAQEITELAPISVKVGIAKGQQTAQTVQVSGRIEAVNSANISTRMMGNVTQVLVKPGDEVKKGDLLVAISSTDLRAKKAQVAAAIAQATSGLQNAEKDYQRFKSLYEKGSASEKELENMTTRYEVAKAGLEAAKQMEREVTAQFAYSNLRAPFDGVVTNTFVKAGDLANPGMPLATVEGKNAFEATVMVPETQIGQVQEGASAQVLVKSKGIALEGTVKEVSPSAKNTGGQYLVKIALEEGTDILPGMFVNAAIVTAGTPVLTSSPFVSEAALIRKGQLTSIYALSEENTAILRLIRTGQTSGDQVEVLSGLSAGERYITQPESKLFNGAQVTVIK